MKQDKAAQTTEEKSFPLESKELKMDLVPLIKIPFEFEFNPVERAERKTQPQCKIEALDSILDTFSCKSEELLPIPKNSYLNICSISEGEKLPYAGIQNDVDPFILSSPLLGMKRLWMIKFDLLLFHFNGNKLETQSTLIFLNFSPIQLM